MYEQMGRKVSGNLFDAPPAGEAAPEEDISEQGAQDAGISPSTGGKSAPSPQEGEADPDPVQTHKELKIDSEPERKIEDAGIKQVVQVMVFYDDDTFRTFRPAH